MLSNLTLPALHPEIIHGLFNIAVFLLKYQWNLQKYFVQKLLEHCKYD